MDKLRKSMRLAGCSSEFVSFATSVLRNQEIIWNDIATVIKYNFICVRVRDGYRTIEIND